MIENPESVAGRCRGVFDPGARVEVLLPLPLAGTYEYRVAGGRALAVGDFVDVPFGGRRLFGVVWGPGSLGVDEGRLKAVSARCDVPPLPDVSRRFVEWVADYTVNPAGAVLRMVMSVPRALLPVTAPAALVLADPGPVFRVTPARQRVLACVSGAPPRTAAELARTAAVAPTVVSGLVGAGVLKAIRKPQASPAEPDWRRCGPRLSAAQAAAAADLRAAACGGFSVTLIDGVAGAGKTEVYFEAVAEALARGRQTLVLLPEIALGAQWLDRFVGRFGAPPALWHSDLGEARRRQTWRAVATGTARVVVGARSALFLPFRDLGLIIVDEEHDPAFKQEDGVAYHARDLAVVRGQLGEVPVMLVSATPSLETVVNVRRGRYQRVVLPDRHADTAPPGIQVVDVRSDPPLPRAWLTPTLRAALVDNLAAGGQSLLFLNRRGYAPLTLCRTCGFRMRCEQCTAWLVEHRLTGRLQCHYCGAIVPLPAECPACGAADSMVGCGPGVERIAEEVAGVVPGARLSVATSDTLAGPKAAAELVARIMNEQVDVVIATQVLAKGYHFPSLTLVGVVDADLGLAGGDLRAGERTFQLLSQVAGRAGRAARPGRVIVQTYMPEHPLIVALAARDRERFLAAETDARAAAAMPPFTRLAALIISGPHEREVDDAAFAIGRAAPAIDGVEILGPAPPPLALLRGRHRRRLLIRAPRAVRLPAVVGDWLARVRLPAGVRVQVDVDPYSFL